MRKYVFIGLAYLILALGMLQACSKDGSFNYTGDNPQIIRKLQECVNTDGQAFISSTDQGVFVYCIHKQGR